MSETPFSSDENQLLGGGQFFLLCLVVTFCYYTALVVCALAVGESVGHLALPFVLLYQGASRAVEVAVEAVNSRRERVYVGVTYDEGQEEDDIFGNLNLPPNLNQ